MGLFSKWFRKTRTILVNGDLTVTLKNGSSIIFHNATRSMYDKVTDMTDEGDIITYYYTILDAQAEEARLARERNETSRTIHEVIVAKESQKQEKAKEREEIQQEINLVKEVKESFPTLTATGDFQEEGGAVYMLSDDKRIPLSIPNSILSKFVSLIKKVEQNQEDSFEEYTALKNFWMWLSLNPVATNRERLYDFITRNGLKINRHGLFFAYRMILSRNGSNSGTKEEVQAISDAYLKIKKAKKGPRNFELIYDEGVYSYQKANTLHDNQTLIGNIADLYEDLSSRQEGMFTDNYTQSFDIRIGREVSQDPSRCDFDSSVTFSRGLHNGSVNYGLYNGFGDTPVLTLINPRNVCAVPSQDVLRSTAYLPVSIIKDTKEAKEVLREGSTLNIADEYYTDSVKQLKELVRNNTPLELKTHEIIGDLSEEALNLIANSVENIEETLSKRTVNVD